MDYNFVFENLGGESPFAKLMKEESVDGLGTHSEIRNNKDVKNAVKKLFGGFKM